MGKGNFLSNFENKIQHEITKENSAIKIQSLFRKKEASKQKNNLLDTQNKTKKLENFLNKINETKKQIDKRNFLSNFENKNQHEITKENSAIKIQSLFRKKEANKEKNNLLMTQN